MKKFKIAFMILSMSVSHSNLLAQIDNLSNMSAEWMRTGARNAATDAADIVVYNPAGISNLDNGLHINFSNQSLFRHPSHSYDLGLGQGRKKYEQASSDPFLPNLYVAYRMNNWSLYSGLFISGGGATLDYPEGSITTDLIGLGALASAQGAYAEVKNPVLKASSMYLTTTLGASYAVTKTFSVSSAIRYISAKNKLNSSLTLTSSPIDLPDMLLVVNTEDKATGIGGVVSINLTPVEHLNLSVRYETQTSLNFKTNQIRDDLGLTTNGATNHRDLPAVFAIGAAYEISPKLKTNIDINYYFQQKADWGRMSMNMSEVPLSTLAGDAGIYAMCFQYQLSPKFLASIGGGYTKLNFNDMAGYYTSMGAFEVVQSDNYNMNMGGAFKVSDKVTLNGGFMHTFYPGDQKVKVLNAAPLDVEALINNYINAVAVGIDLKF
jgi:long-chain fatty acid transport protein